MIFATVNKIPGFLLDKLGLLFKLLKERKNEYELFAGKLQDKQLKRSVLSLAQETNQYAVELSGQIQTLSGRIVPDEEAGNQDSTLQFVPEENEILASCEVSEKKMIIAYREILNEPYLHENLRKLIRCQLNGLTYAFMQIKLLKTSFHR